MSFYASYNRISVISTYFFILSPLNKKQYRFINKQNKPIRQRISIFHTRRAKERKYNSLTWAVHPFQSLGYLWTQQPQSARSVRHASSCFRAWVIQNVFTISLTEIFINLPKIKCTTGHSYPVGTCFNTQLETEKKCYHTWRGIRPNYSSRNIISIDTKNIYYNTY